MGLVAMYGLFADPAQIERHVAALSVILPPEAARVVMRLNVAYNEDERRGIIRYAILIGAEIDAEMERQTGTAGEY